MGKYSIHGSYGQGGKNQQQWFHLALIHPSPSFEVPVTLKETRSRCDQGNPDAQLANLARIKLLHTAHGHMSDSQT